MAEVICLFEYLRASVRGATHAQAVRRATLNRAPELHVCIACGGTWRTARGYERHRCKEARHVGP